jgi:UDP-galactopyranose mutase
MIEKMLDGIPLLLGFDYLQHRALCRPTRRLVYTGPIDEFFGFSLGRLQYRSQRRTHSFIADSAYVQPCGQVNTPDPASGPSIRTLEWKHMMPASEADRIAGTLLTTETPYSPEEPENYEYPFPDAANQNLYAQYRAMAEALPEVLICGRLGEYKYYDMDQAVARALLLARRLLESHPAAVELLGSLSR